MFAVVLAAGFLALSCILLVLSSGGNKVSLGRISKAEGRHGFKADVIKSCGEI